MRVVRNVISLVEYTVFMFDLREQSMVVKITVSVHFTTSCMSFRPLSPRAWDRPGILLEESLMKPQRQKQRCPALWSVHFLEKMTSFCQTENIIVL